MRQPSPVTRSERPNGALDGTQSKIQWVISTFKPLKLAGPNETVPALLQQGTVKLVTHLCHICTACKARGYTPKAWRQIKVTSSLNLAKLTIPG